MTNANPVIAEILRGTIVESQHRGAFAVVDVQGRVLKSAGDIHKAVFPRSAVKAFQCVPVIQSGAADHFGLTDEEIALCCASHTGEPEHVRVAASILRKAGIDETAYECGTHWPERMDDRVALIKAGEAPRAIHNNCSGKHAGMLLLAKHLGAPLSGYVSVDHPVQKAVAEALDHYCDANTAKAPKGIDGCSVPTWALPLENAARGFAKLFAPGNTVGERIAKAVRNSPFMLAGTGKFDTRIMQAVPRLFIKYGAEAVYCGAIPHAGLGFALKIDDGAARAAEVAIARMLCELDCWTEEESDAIGGFTHSTLRNWRKLEVGESRASF
jgi:L-asparaginase II